MQCSTLADDSLVTAPIPTAFQSTAPRSATQGSAIAPMATEDRQVLDLLKRHAPLHGAIDEKLGKVIAAAVATPGGLIRFHLARQMAESFGASTGSAESLACAIEFFHIASLLLDDLPQMDNSLERRGRICPHLLYGEDVVMLGALGLITRAYALLGGVVCSVPAERQRPAHALIERCLGTAGILNGQARDLNFARTGGGHRAAVSIAMGKTVPLIQLALSVPALLFGADRRTLSQLRRLSVFWGLLYQASDDLKDLLHKTAVSGKTAGRDAELGRPNIALIAGENGVSEYLKRLDRLADRCLTRAVTNCPELAFLGGFQQMLRARWEALVS